MCLHDPERPQYFSFTFNLFVKPEDNKIGLNNIATFQSVASEFALILMFPDNTYGHIKETNAFLQVSIRASWPYCLVSLPIPTPNPGQHPSMLYHRR